MAFCAFVCVCVWPHRYLSYWWLIKMERGGRATSAETLAWVRSRILRWDHFTSRLGSWDLPFMSPTRLTHQCSQGICNRTKTNPHWEGCLDYSSQRCLHGGKYLSGVKYIHEVLKTFTSVSSNTGDDPVQISSDLATEKAVIPSFAYFFNYTIRCFFEIMDNMAADLFVINIWKWNPCSVS